MILVEIRPRQDDLFDIWVIGANGEVLLNSSQGYENSEDAEAIARKLFGSVDHEASHKAGFGVANTEPVALRITYRTGKTHTEQLR